MTTGFEQSVGYALKRAQTAVRAALESALRDHGLSVPQYACLQQLADRPGLTNAELARGAFVSRQAMHQLLIGLEAARLVLSKGAGRNERFSLSAEGARRADDAADAASAVEAIMLAGLGQRRRAQLRADLVSCADALAL